MNRMREGADYSNGIEDIANQSPESSSQPGTLVVVFPGYRQQVTEALLGMGYKPSDYDIAPDIEDGRRRAQNYSVVITDNSQVASNALEGAAIEVDKGRTFSGRCLDVDAVDFNESLAERIKGICGALKEETEYAAAQEPELEGRRYKLLVIEDDENQRELYRQELGELYDLVMPDTAEDTDYALNELGGLGIDLIVADQSLWKDAAGKEVTGLQLLAQATESNPEVPKILYTGNDDALAVAREEGHYAVKRSADLTGLKDAIASLLSKAPKPFTDGTEREIYERLTAPLPEESLDEEEEPAESEAVRSTRRVHDVLRRELSPSAISTRDRKDS